MISVFCTVAFSILIVNSVVLADSSGEEACEAVFNTTIIENVCCESVLLIDDSSKSTQCGHSSEEGELMCDDFKCILEEEGLLEDDKISEEKAKEMLDELEKKSPDEKGTIDRVRRECLDGKYLKYYDGDCEPLKFFTCLYINTIIECQLWKKDAECNTMKENVQVCKKALDI